MIKTLKTDDGVEEKPRLGLVDRFGSTDSGGPTWRNQVLGAKWGPRQMVEGIPAILVLLQTCLEKV